MEGITNIKLIKWKVGQVYMSEMFGCLNKTVLFVDAGLII